MITGDEPSERYQAWSGLPTTKRSISKAEAIDLLTRTSTNNRTGLIGGPYSVTGYTLSGSINIINQCEKIEASSLRGQEAICAVLPGKGAHVWYLRLEPRKIVSVPSGICDPGETVTFSRRSGRNDGISTSTV